VLTTPLGSTLARLEGTASRVRLELPDGRVAEAADWEALTSNVLGAPIPVRGLAWWVRGAPHPGSPHTIERDAAARTSVLWQDGWEIVYGYGEGGDRPARLRLTYPDTDLRLVLDAWNDAP
jgi:outer membrane lipoprotein LolB